MRTDNTAPIAHLGSSGSQTAFALTVLARSPFGRTNAKLEWEVKPLGTPFDGAGTQSSVTWHDTGTSGVDINELVTGLTKHTRYHWRGPTPLRSRDDAPPTMQPMVYKSDQRLAGSQDQHIYSPEYAPRRRQ